MNWFHLNLNLIVVNLDITGFIQIIYFFFKYPHHFNDKAILLFGLSAHSTVGNIKAFKCLHLAT